MGGARPGTYSVVLVLFLLSGLSGLVYEVIWVRMLTRVLGATTFAVSALLTAFMAGLALGSYLSGRLLARTTRALLLFGAIEIGVGLYALALPELLPVAEGVFTSAVAQAGLSLFRERLLKLVFSLALLVPPTTLMGASLPLLSQHTVERFGHLGLRVGQLYAVNTWGAVLGCFLAGFHAIPAWGIRGTTLAAALINLTVGVLAVALGRSGSLPSLPPALETRPPLQEAEGPARYEKTALRWVTLAFAVSGFAALGFEVVWTRLVALVFVGYTYSFTIMLTVFLTGIAAGSFVFGRMADRVPDPLRFFGWLEMAIGLSVLAVSPLFLQAPVWVQRLAPALGGGFEGQMAAKFGVAFALLILPTFLFGGTFPVVTRVAARSLEGLGATVGGLYAANVAGGIAGSFATGYLLIPLLGADQSLRVLCGLLLLVGLLVIASTPVRARTGGAAAALAGAGALMALAMGPSDLSFAIHRSWLVPGERMAFYREGVEATVMVAVPADPHRSSAKRILVSGSSASNSTHYGLSVNRIQGTLPFLFAQMPRRVLAICFGTGITFGTLTQFEVERVDGVEISPEVIQAAPRFGVENYDVVRNPRFRLHIDDGRNFLLKSRERYDAITMEPMPPALAGVVDFYTRDFYRLGRSRLQPGGVLSQWVPLYFLGLDDVKMLYKTFADAFPHAMVFCYNFDTFLVGSDRPLDLSGARFRQRLRSERLERDLAVIDLSRPEQMLGTFLMGREGMRRFAGSAAVLSDDHPLVEFTAPKSAVGGAETAYANLRALLPLVEPASRYLGHEAEDEDAALRQALDELFRRRQRAAGFSLASETHPSAR